MTLPAAPPSLELDAQRAERLAEAHVVVLAGGVSVEREVSLRSGAEILRGLLQEDGQGPASVRLVEIDERGRWGWGGERWSPLEAMERLGHVDAFFLAMHGGSGEDGTLQGFFECLGVRYTGSPVRASALCMDKRASRSLAAEAGLRIPRGICLGADEVLADVPRAADLARRLDPAGWAVKPRSGGSSVTTFVLAADGDLEGALQAVARTGDDVLVEQRIDGVECSCGVLERPDGGVLALPPIEIQPRSGHFFDYQQKYSPEGARELCPPESLGGAVLARVQADAVRFFELTGCRGHARIDFMVPADGLPVLLEANTLPGFTNRSLLPQEAAAVGIDYRSLCLWVLAGALGDDGEQHP